MTDHDFEGLRQQDVRVVVPERNAKDYKNVEVVKDTWMTGRFRELVKKYIRPANFAGFIEQLSYFIGLKRVARDFLVRENVCVLVLVGDRHVGWETAFVQAANKMDIKSLIVPFALSHPESNLKRVKRREMVVRQSWAGKAADTLLQKLYGDWFFGSDGVKYCYHPRNKAVAAKLSGLMPRNPWSQAGGYATRVAVESEQARGELTSQGVEDKKIVVTGKPLSDISYGYDSSASKRRALKATLGADSDDKLIVFALPQYAEHKRLDWDKHFELIDNMLEIISAQGAGAKIIVSLHPKSKRTNYAEMISSHNAILSTVEIYKLVSVCDVYVAGLSSTITTAIGLGKPVIAFDIFDEGENLFKNAPGVELVTTLPELGKSLRKTLCNGIRSNADRSKWALFDGRCTDRVIGELCALSQ